MRAVGGAGAGNGLPRTFGALIAAWSGSLTGDGLRVVALPLLAASIDRSPAAVAAVAVATALPWLLIAVPAGALVDRLNPAKAILVAHLVRAGATGGLVLVIGLGGASIAVLCAAGFAITSAETFADSAAQTLLVRIVPHPDLERANARFVMVETIALDLVGPLSGGALFVVASWLPFAVSAVLFVLSAIVISTLIWTPAAAAMPPAADAPAGLGVRAGLKQLFGDRVLRVLVITVAIMAAANAAVDGQLVLYATGPLQLSDALYPTLLAAYSVGTLLAAVLIGRIAARFHGGRSMLVGLAGIGGTMLVMGLFPSPVVAWICYGVMGMAGGTWNVLSATRRQRRTPLSMIARVSSAFRVVAWGVIPIGAGAGGAIGEGWSVPGVFTVSGIVVLVLGAVVARHFAGAEPTRATGGGDDAEDTGHAP